MPRPRRNLPTILSIEEPKHADIISTNPADMMTSTCRQVGNCFTVSGGDVLNLSS